MAVKIAYYSVANGNTINEKLDVIHIDIKKIFDIFGKFDFEK